MREGRESQSESVQSGMEKEKRERRRGRDSNPRGLRLHDFQSCALGRTMRPLHAVVYYTIEEGGLQILVGATHSYGCPTLIGDPPTRGYATAGVAPTWVASAAG